MRNKRLFYAFIVVLIYDAMSGLFQNDKFILCRRFFFPRGALGVKISLFFFFFPPFHIIELAMAGHGLQSTKSVSHLYGWKAPLETRPIILPAHEHFKEQYPVFSQEMNGM